MLIIRNISIVCAILAAAVLGGCSGCSKKTEVPADITPADEVHTVLEQPQRFDAQGLDELAEKVRQNADFSPAELANMMIQAEAVSNRVSMEAERLVQVDDPADTYWTLKEFAESQWWADYSTVMEWLGQAQLPGEIATRYGMLLKANKRVNDVITSLESRDNKSRNLLDI